MQGPTSMVPSWYPMAGSAWLAGSDRVSGPSRGADGSGTIRSAPILHRSLPIDVRTAIVQEDPSARGRARERCSHARYESSLRASDGTCGVEWSEDRPRAGVPGHITAMAQPTEL